MYKFRVYFRNAVERDKDTGHLVLDRTKFEQLIGHSNGHAIVELVDGTNARARGLYPNNRYKDETKTIENAKEYQEEHPDEKVFYVKEIDITKEQYEGAWNVLEKFEPYKGKEIPKEVLGHIWTLFGYNCSDLVNTAYRGTGLPGNFTDKMTSQEVDQVPGLVAWYVKSLGGFGVGDKTLTVLGTSVEQVAKKYNVPEWRVSQRESIPGVPDADLAIEQEAANHKTFVIAPNPELVASPASEEVLTPIQHDDESMEKLAVALEQGLYLFEDGALKKSYGKGLPGKPIAIDYNTEQGKYKDLMRDGHPLRRSVVYLPIHEAIASGTEGRYTAQDLLELQRSNFQAITTTSQSSMLASDGDKKPAFDENSTPSTASDSEEEQQHSVQQNTAPADPEYEDYLIGSKAMMASFPFLLQQIEERSGLYSYESWKKAHDIGMEIAKTSKVKSIIEAALKAFKEKFEAIRDKFTKKLKDDIEKSAKDASDSQQNGQAEYDAKAQAIHQQKAQEIGAMKEQLQSTYNSQASEIAQRKKGEIDAFFQQGQAECDAVFAARSGAASNQPSTSGLALSYVVSNSDVVAQKNSELSTFKAQKIAEMEAEQQALLAQTHNQLKSFIASKEAEAAQQCNALKSSIEQRLKSTQESKIKQIAEAATNKEKAQVAECNRKVKDIQENTDLIERLKEVVGNSGDAEAVINEELNVVLQGAASDFGVDAVTL